MNDKATIYKYGDIEGFDGIDDREFDRRTEEIVEFLALKLDGEEEYEEIERLLKLLKKGIPFEEAMKQVKEEE